MRKLKHLTLNQRVDGYLLSMVNGKYFSKYKNVAQPEIAQRESDITFAVRAAGKSLLWIKVLEWLPGKVRVGTLFSLLLY